MRRLLSVLALASVALALVVFSQTSTIVATPIYLSVPMSYVVFNAVNVTYLNLPTATDLAYYTITTAAQHINITIKLVNVYNGSVMEFNAWIPQSEYDHIYLAPNISSIIFFINATSTTDQPISPYVAGNVGLVYNISGKQVNTVYAIGLGNLVTYYNGKVVPVSSLPIFQQYFNGQKGVQYSVLNGWEGIYVLYVTT